MKNILTLQEYSIQEGKKALKYHQENPFIYSNNGKVSIDSIYITEGEREKIKEYYNNLKELQSIAEGKKIGKIYLYYYMRVYLEDQDIGNEDRKNILKEVSLLDSSILV